MCSVGIVWLSALGISFALVFCESTFHKGATKFLARTVTGAIRISDWLIGGIHKLPCVVAIFLVLLSVTTCGALALCLGCGFYFLKLTQMSQDYVEGFTMRIVKYFLSKFKKRVLPQNSNEDVDSSQNRLIDSDLSDRALTKVKDETVSKEDEQNQVIENKSNQNVEEEEEVEVNEAPEIQEEKKEIDVSPSCSSCDTNVESSNQQTTEINKSCEENNEQNNVRNEPAEHSSIFFHFSIFLLWFIVTGLNIPSVLTWAHNFKYNTVLQPDPSFLPGFILSLCGILLWQMDLPKPNISYYVQIGYLLNFMAAVSLLYAPISVYRIVYIITAAIVLITLHQFLAPTRADVIEDQTETETPDASNPLTLLHKMKAKWE
ncbi:hypothetical protein ILUMI_23470 [Ignelater luminosus]|uniref:Uncharacterized protein n=1 Tax=Ignelater luminosus TaxID=2038154 RepID=A0A8K0CCH2_IGNLU|nr:hypothetical protein ILUMI_23470 [Ignelater luminosus]